MQWTRVIASPCLFLLGTAAWAGTPCAEALVDESELDSALNDSNFVFVATVTGENEQGTTLHYQLHSPALKGVVPLTGELTQAKSCWGIPFLNGSAILLLLMDSLDQPISISNWKLVALGPGEPGLTWVAEWLVEKTSNNALH